MCVPSFLKLLLSRKFVCVSVSVSLCVLYNTRYNVNILLLKDPKNVLEFK